MNLVEREGKRLESDLNTVKALHIEESTSTDDVTCTVDEEEVVKDEDVNDSGVDAKKDGGGRVKCVRFNDNDDDNKKAVGTQIGGSESRPKKSILKSEASDNDCSSDTGLSSLSVSSEEGTYALTTLV